ncbi:MAG: MerC domain-containing protein [Chitinophagales bacterium]
MGNPKEHKHNHSILRLSFWLSTLCLIHCIVFPILIVLLPVFNMAFEINHWVEISLLGSTLFLGLYSLYHGYKLHHKDIRPIVIFLVGMGIAFFMHLVLHSHQNPSTFKMCVEIFGSLLIAASQFWNLRLTKSNACTNHNH